MPIRIGYIQEIKEKITGMSELDATLTDPKKHLQLRKSYVSISHRKN